MMTTTRSEQLIARARELGFEDSDQALRAHWNQIPAWLREDLVNLGFNPNSSEVDNKKK
jgi:hypothetical protein